MNQPVAATQPRRRRWFSFGLRSFFLFVALVAVGLAWVVYERAESRRQLQIVEQLDGVLRVRFGGPFDVGMPGYQEQSWWRRLAGTILGQRVRWLEIGNSTLDDATPLGRLSNLKLLSITGSRISDISPLARLTELEGLFFNNAPVADISPLASLTSLHNVDVNDTFVRKDQVEQLMKALPNCSCERWRASNFGSK